MVLSIVKAVTKLALPTALLLTMVVACNPGSTQAPTYGVKIEYAEGQPLSFPGLTLEFVGKRESPGSPEYPRGMVYYDFKAYQGSRAQLVSWTAGTGDIGPALFELAGNRYALELAMSDKLGPLDEDELVLWREAIPATEAPLATPMPTPPSPPREAQDYYDKGFAQFAAGLPQEAVASFTQAIALYPTYIEAYQFRGDAYRDLGRYDLVRADYEQVLVLEPQPEVLATVTAALRELPEAKTVEPTPTQALPTPASLPSVKITLGEPFTLALTQYGRLDATGLSVEFHEVVEDARCPRQVECESAGWARIAIFVWIPNVEPVEFILNTDPATNKNVVLYDEYQVRLLSLEPYPETSVTDIAPQDYRTTFVVSK